MNTLPRTATSLTLGRALVSAQPGRSAVAPARPVAVSVSPGTCAPARDGEAGGVGSALRWVVVVGFGQMIFFGLLFLAFCAKAETTAPAGAARIFPPPLKESVYQPQTRRDPFTAAMSGVSEAGSAAVAVESAPVVLPGELRLEGILLDPRAPSAVINDRIVERGKPVTLRTGTRELTVVAEEIRRETVILRVGEQTVTLRLGTPSDAATSREGGMHREP
ncbi:MAG: hypothetical protein NZ483_05445 [Verrucomicrobiae bacterium]|nr:hypothetical protein [Verrucomicrobiae bacterium]MDW8342971.1 hypothetical protein [Verrucomicrobiae bacterium]